MDGPEPEPETDTDTAPDPEPESESTLPPAPANDPELVPKDSKEDIIVKGRGGRVGLWARKEIYEVYYFILLSKKLL